VTLVIRPAQPEDVPTMVEIEGQSFASPNWDAAHFLSYDCWIAEVDGIVAGFLVSREIFAGDANSPAQREILNVAVAPSFRRRGIATRLITQELTRSGETFLEVRESNAVARKLYRKLGFVEVGQRPEYYGSPVETAIVMTMK
jgi:ribosomal-protein-alanine N-acetyltransferase